MAELERREAHEADEHHGGGGAERQPEAVAKGDGDRGLGAEDHEQGQALEARATAAAATHVVEPQDRAGSARPAENEQRHLLVVGTKLYNFGVESGEWHFYTTLTANG